MYVEVPKNYAEETTEKTMMFACQWGSCSQMFASVAELSSHLDLVDIPFNSAVGKWSCQWAGCSRNNHVFKSRYRLVRHMLTHTGSKPHACDMCPKTFARRENLKIHRRLHTGEKPFECRANEECQKRFSNSSDRIKHERSHKDTKYKCPSCEFICFTPQTIAKHHKKSHGTKVPKESTSCVLLPKNSPKPKTHQNTPPTPEVNQTTTTPELGQIELAQTPMTNVFLQTDYNSLSSPTNTFSTVPQTIPSAEPSPELVPGTVPEFVPFPSIKQEACDQTVPDMANEFPFYSYQMQDPNMYFYAPNDYLPSYHQDQNSQYINYFNQTALFQHSAHYFH